MRLETFFKISLELEGLYLYKLSTDWQEFRGDLYLKGKIYRYIVWLKRESGKTYINQLKVFLPSKKWIRCDEDLCI